MWAAGATLFELRYGYPFLTNLRGVQRAKAYTTELIGRSSELPQSPPELQEYYTGRASQARARNMKIDTIDRFILELLQVKPSQRPSAEEALKHWEIIEKSLEADKWNTDPRMGL
jgi:serine/threonine protein kinase